MTEGVVEESAYYIRLFFHQQEKTVVNFKERMGHLHTSLVLFLLFCSPWPSNGTNFLTHLGTQCIEDCKNNWGGYKCKTIEKDGKCQEIYCSPQENMDYRGRECGDDNKCLKDGQDYDWCRIDTFHWGYSELSVDDENHYGSYYELICNSKCDKGILGYYWCYTDKGWDYCSPYEKTDCKNRQCRDDSPCGRQDENYNWCWLKEGSWGHCGRVEPKMILHRSKYYYVRTDECQYHESGDYYWCNTTKNWAYCSPNVDITYQGKPCRLDHSCGLHDSSYNWSLTPESDSDYCAPIESGECTSLLSTSQDCKSTAPGDKILICTKVDKGTKKKTTFTAEPAPDAITDGSEWRNEAENLISCWDNGYLVDQARSNLIHSANLRIDMQGFINRNNLRYYNLQIQVNVRRVPGQSTTVSQIFVPAAQVIPRRYIRRAFLESFRRRARVSIDISIVNQC